MTGNFTGDVLVGDEMARGFVRTPSPDLTYLDSGDEVEKNNPIVEVMGAVEELEATLAVTIAFIEHAELARSLAIVREELSELRRQLGSKKKLTVSIDQVVAAVELAATPASVAGSNSAGFAFALLARAQARKAERRLVTLHETSSTGLGLSDFRFAGRRFDQGLRYLNMVAKLMELAAAAAPSPDHP